MSAIRISRNRVRMLRTCILSTNDGRWPYDDDNALMALRDVGLMDAGARITARGVQAVIANLYQEGTSLWLQAEETRRILDNAEEIGLFKR
jgi:hypothetical protein